MLGMGLRAEALHLFKLQQRLCEEIGDRPGLANCYGAQAAVYKQEGQSERALELHQLESRIAAESNDRGYWPDRFLTKGVRCCLSSDQGGLPVLEEGERLARELKLKHELMVCLISQAIALALDPMQLELAYGKLAEAEGICQEALSALSTICKSVGSFWMI